MHGLPVGYGTTAKQRVDRWTASVDQSRCVADCSQPAGAHEWHGQLADVGRVDLRGSDQVLTTNWFCRSLKNPSVVIGFFENGQEVLAKRRFMARYNHQQ